MEEVGLDPHASRKIMQLFKRIRNQVAVFLSATWFGKSWMVYVDAHASARTEKRKMLFRMMVSAIVISSLL